MSLKEMNVINRRIKHGINHLAARLLGKSELDYTIPADFERDETWQKLSELAAREDIREILEVGSSDGRGSTSAIVDGMTRNPSNPQLHCLEVSRLRFRKLSELYSSFDNVHCYNMPSVSIAQYPVRDIVDEMRLRSKCESSLEKLLFWYDQEIEYITRERMDANGIREIKRLNGIDIFDMVLLDGSEFAGEAELAEVYGAKYIVLDDINVMKNSSNYAALCRDSAYNLYHQAPTARNGFACFLRT